MKKDPFWFHLDGKLVIILHGKYPALSLMSFDSFLFRFAQLTLHI